VYQATVTRGYFLCTSLANVNLRQTHTSTAVCEIHTVNLKRLVQRNKSQAVSRQTQSVQVN